MRRWKALLLSVPVVLALGPLALRAQPAADCLVIENFARARIGEFPADWKPRKEAGREVYSVREENGLRFLRAVSRGLGIQAAKQVDDWNLDTHPILTWSWRPRQFPEGGDESNSRTNDSVMAVYMLVPYSRITGPKAVKYIWSQVVPVGTHLTSSQGLTQVRVLRTGTQGTDQWTEERVNVLEDYKNYHGETQTPKSAGIAVLTDSDDTRSSAGGDYASFRACRG